MPTVVNKQALRVKACFFYETEKNKHGTVVHHCIGISQFLLFLIQSLFGDDGIYVSSNQTSPKAGFNRLLVKENTTGELWRVVENILEEFSFFQLT